MKVIQVTPFEAEAIRAERPSCWQWIARNWVRARALDLADYSVDVVQIRCGNQRIATVPSQYIGRSGVDTRSAPHTIPDETVRSIREGLSKNMPVKHVARENGVSESTVRNIKTGRRYLGIGLVETGENDETDEG